MSGTVFTQQERAEQIAALESAQRQAALAGRTYEAAAYAARLRIIRGY